MSIDIEDITSIDSAKLKLKELSEDYKIIIDELLKKSYEAAIVREQINNCLELIVAFKNQEESSISGE